jgi:hypothetical protein
MKLARGGGEAAVIVMFCSFAELHLLLALEERGI